MSICDLVRRDAVHECHERTTLILVTRQGGHDCQTDLLRHVVGRKLTTLSRTDSSPAIPDDEWSDEFQDPGQSQSIALRCGNDERVQLLTRTVHRRQISPRYRYAPAWERFHVVVERTKDSDTDGPQSNRSVRVRLRSRSTDRGSTQSFECGSQVARRNHVRIRSPGSFAQHRRGPAQGQ